VPWEEIIGMRNRLIPEYFEVNLEIVWRTVQEDLELLEVAVKTMLDEFS